MQIIPDRLLQIVQKDKNLHKALLDIDSKIENIIANNPPFFFYQYTDHGITHFVDTLRMAVHLIDVDEIDRFKGKNAVIDYFNPLNAVILSSSILFHDIGMHIHFNGFKQLINGYYDDVKVDFFDDYTWKQEWDNFMIEAKRFSGRERINLFGDEQVIIRDIDFSKSTVDSDVQKNLIGEFIRRHHGRLAHEVINKGFPVLESEIIEFAVDLPKEYKDLIGLIARSHTLEVRDALSYVEEKFPADPHFPYEIEVPFIMCVLRVADYFQFDRNRTNVFLIKLRSFTSLFSLKEHQAHLATEYFKTDDKDPETLFVDLKPSDGLMYTKLVRLFDDIQKEIDTSFAICGEMYGRNKEYLKLRYRRIKTSLKNRKVISKLPYIAESFRFEADTDLFKLLVGPLYGYAPSYGVRELIQNSVDACIELKHKIASEYVPEIEININKTEDQYVFTICDNGKGMSVGEIKNYFLKAGASFRNSTEWKIDYQTEENKPVIRRTGKFGIGVLASFLIGDSIEVITKRYNETVGHVFTADLNNELIEVRKNYTSKTGTTIKIRMNENTYNYFIHNKSNITKWYLLSYPKINYYINKSVIKIEESGSIALENNEQKLDDSIRLKYQDFDDIIWSYSIVGDIAINGILIPNKYYYPTPYKYNEERIPTIYDELSRFPFISILDRNNLIDLELNRNAIRGHLPFINELVESCKLDFLYKLIFFNVPIENDILSLKIATERYANEEHGIQLNAPQFSTNTIYTTTEGYFLDNTFYKPLIDNLHYYKIFTQYGQTNKIRLVKNSICSLTHFYGVNSERNILRGDYRGYMAISRPRVYEENFDSPSITKNVRDKLTIISKNKNYIIFKTSDFKQNKIEDLQLLLKINNAEAVQLIDKSLSSNKDVYEILKKHLGAPKLIPHGLKEKINYVKTLSPELRNHIIEKRGIRL